MAAVETSTVVATAAVKIAENTYSGAQPGDEGGRSWLIKNLTKTAVVWVGADNAVTDTVGGFPWDTATDGALRVTLEPGEVLWARLAAGAANQSLVALRTGR